MERYLIEAEGYLGGAALFLLGLIVGYALRAWISMRRRAVTQAKRYSATQGQ